MMNEAALGGLLEDAGEGRLAELDAGQGEHRGRNRQDDGGRPARTFLCSAAQTRIDSHAARLIDEYRIFASPVALGRWKADVQRQVGQNCPEAI
jgi:hypothetical protein